MKLQHDVLIPEHLVESITTLGQEMSQLRETTDETVNALVRVADDYKTVMLINTGVKLGTSLLAAGVVLYLGRKALNKF